ncbi:MAG: 16S rRNA (guanine(527)-N(7))-methyltransferase RsmG [Oscillospiraceae bacterium]|nr:16S rRNA (guanine(527)-N(7))-methyltransferase RsmG [Oscillospiraceae bacterium]MDE6657082.1 16S rRNA (guanine(527)-N(7))-methyltransferase RsmG [Oscillospiraceae bacterium]
MAILPEYEQAKQVFEKFNIHVPRGTFEKLENYAEFLVEYNQHVNLTAITDGKEILEKHFLDSLLLCQLASDYIPESAKLLDIGSGAGFPAVPVALIRPDLQITLLDSLHKRIIFLEKLRELLNCNYNSIHGRAEDFAKKSDYRENFDIVTARAVASLPVLAEFSLPYVKTGGYWIAMKGPNEEITPALQAIQVLGGKLIKTIPYQLANGDARILYLVKKISPCPTKYPRKIAQIKQKSL